MQTTSLLATGEEGVAQAELVLKKSGYVIDFSEHFRDWRTRGVDLLRPKGGKYPGISAEVDRSLGEAVEEQEEITDDADFSFQLFDGKKALEEEEKAVSQRELHSIWMDLEEGKPPGHKKTILRLSTDPTLDIDYRASHDRLLRVRYFSIGGDHWNRDSKSHIYQPSSGELFTLGSLYATAICSEQKVSVAILQCTSLKSSSQYLDRATLEEISLPDSSYDVSGRILSLHSYQDSSNTQTLNWAWNSQFVSLEAAKSRPQQAATTTRIRHLSFAVNGRLVLPLLSRQFNSIQVSDLPPNTMKEITAEKTWVITDKDLQEIRLSLLRRLQEDENTRSKIPVYGKVRDGAFPYTSIHPSNPAMIIEHSIISIHAPTAANAPQACCICGHQVAGPDRQNHMGGHILRRLRGVEESFENIGSKVSMQYPCGFCTQSSLNGACSIHIQSGKAISTCSRAYDFKISAASKISKQKACTNVPIQCKFCPDVHWKYNMHRHLQERHPSWESNRGAGSELKEFREKIAITNEEENRLKIPEDKQGWSAVIYIDAYDLRRLNHLPSIHDSRGDSPRRPRQTPFAANYPPIPPISLPIPPSYTSSMPAFNNTLNVFH
ncbi:hypothetical protein CPB84DRAFT_1859091 [Gymnopilus junonius]|uniref:Uncharacterized protein n=1 Tax=Gymnopilus junonius TaxID=109634 RepID=A0A9P5N8J7_GYMJU|nr:hypothetical protein CPB84DRAFT_1859091 [Gymnopilus junonius]